MKVKCIGNKGNSLSKYTVDMHHSPNSRFEIKLGEAYNVYGILLWDNILYYLTINMYNDRPDWYPAELFEVVDYRLPFEWFYEFYGYEAHITAIWGYNELVYIKKHHDNLFEREEEALRIFTRRKLEIDNFDKQKYIIYDE